MKSTLIVAVVAPLVLHAAAAAHARPKPPEASPVEERHFGSPVVDPYRYFERLDDPRTREYLETQGAHARAQLDAIPGREQLLREMLEVNLAAATVGGVQRIGGRHFYLKSAPGESRPQLYSRTEADATEALLFSPGTLDGPQSRIAISGFSVSPDAGHIALAVAANDAEIGELRILDTRSGELLPERIGPVGFTLPHWAPDGRSFTYTRLRPDLDSAPAAEKHARKAVFRHRVGDDPAQDTLLLGPGFERGVALRDEFWPSIVQPEGSRYAFAAVQAVTARSSFALWRMPRQQLGDPEARWTPVVGEADRISAVAWSGDRLYLRSALDAPRFRILALDPDDAEEGMSRAREVLPHGDDVVGELASAADALYVSLDRGGEARLLRIPHDGARSEEIRLPFPASLAGLAADTARPGAVFRLNSWVVSPRYYAVDAGATVPRELDLLSASPIDFSAMTATRVEVVSHDGTRVPLSIVRHRDTPLDGARPTIVRGYGAYGASQQPAFWPFARPLLVRGGVFAVCHVRGGGERGEQWHRDGQRERKRNSFDDFIACLEHMNAQGYSSPRTLAASGGSAGGILVGRVLSLRPDLLRAAMIDVPLADTLRMETAANGPNQRPEFGSIADPAGFRALRDMSPYGNLVDGTDYPAVLVTTGMNDARVAPWHAAKLAARLQAATRSGRPVLLRVDRDTGHGVTVARNQFADLLTDHLAFLFWQTGTPGFQPGR